MWTMPLEMEALESAADHGAWAKARGMVSRVVRPAVEDRREERMPA
jgi:hypothetical protein